MKTEAKQPDMREPQQIFKEVDQNILEYKQMEQYILNSLKTEGSKLPVPQLRFPETDKADAHNFTLSHGFNKRGKSGDDCENVDPGETKHVYGFT
jgi:hypothetical protein